MHVQLGSLVVMCSDRECLSVCLSVCVLLLHNFCLVTDSSKPVAWAKNLQCGQVHVLPELPQNSQPPLHFWITSLHIQQPSRDVTCTGGASVQGAALGTRRNHTTSARITPSRIRVLVLSAVVLCWFHWFVCTPERQVTSIETGHTAASQSQDCRRDDSTKRRLLTQVPYFSHFSYPQYKSNRACGHLTTNYNRYQSLHSHTMSVPNLARIPPGRPDNGLKNRPKHDAYIVPIQ